MSAETQAFLCIFILFNAECIFNYSNFQIRKKEENSKEKGAYQIYIYITT